MKKDYSKIFFLGHEDQVNMQLIPFHSTQDYNDFLGVIEQGLNAIDLFPSKGILPTQFQKHQNKKLVRIIRPSGYICSFHPADQLNCEEDHPQTGIDFVFSDTYKIFVPAVGDSRIGQVIDKLYTDINKLVERGKITATTTYLQTYLQDNVHEFSVNLKYLSQHLVGIFSRV